MKKYFSLIFCLIVLVSVELFAQSSTFLDEQSSFGNLTTPPISITIGGDFLITGSFPAYSGERVDQFVTRMYNEARTQVQYPTNNTELFLQFVNGTQNYSLRGIKLRHKNSEEETIDLLRFRLSGDFADNPYLMNDDVIIFPKYDLEYNFVEISGAVNKPTKFQFIEGDELTDAIFFAQGINDAYENINKAIISRLSYDGASEEQIIVSIDDNVELERGDRIKIVADKTERKSYKVLVMGEVNQPGYIFITKDNTTLQEVIEKSGGFTENASLKDAQLLRNFDQSQLLKKHALKREAANDPEMMSQLLSNDNNRSSYLDQLELLRMMRSANLLSEDSISFNIDNQLRLLERNSLVDFTGLDSVNSPVSSFVVKDGDIITIPEKYDAVYVFGQVGNPGYHKFVAGKKMDYYIDAAGGLTEMAKDDDEVFLIKGNTREWISIDEKNYTVEPGDYIYAVRKIRQNFWFYVSRVGTVAGIIGSIATLVLLFE